MVESRYDVAPGMSWPEEVIRSTNLFASKMPDFYEIQFIDQAREQQQGINMCISQEIH